MVSALAGQAIAVLDDLVASGQVPAWEAAAASAKSHIYGAALEQLGHEGAAKALAVKVVNLLSAKRDLWYRAIPPSSRPYGLVLDPANGCGLHCPGCVHSVSAISRRLFDWPAAMLSGQSAARFFAKYGPYAIQAKFCNYGEPLLNPETPRFIAMAREYFMQTMLSSSLSVRKFAPQEYVRSGLDYMVMSIDGATQPVYSRYRRNGSLDLALANLAAIAAEKRRLGSAVPVLCWQFLTFEHNAHEIDDAIRLARQAGADEFHAVPPFDVTWDDPAIRAAPVEPRRVEFGQPPGQTLAAHLRDFPALFDEAAIDAAYERAHGPQFEAGAGPSCRWLYKNMAMDALGRIMPCCGAPERGNGGLVLGHIRDEDPFTSPRYRQARLWFVNPDVANGHQCGRCPWPDSAADIDSIHVASYLRAVGPPLFGPETVRILAEW